jgi:hypothetical protein
MRESRRQDTFADADHKYVLMNDYGRRTSTLFRHPRTTAASYSLLKPFTKTVWLCALLSWALMMATIHLVNWLEFSQHRHGQQHSDHSLGATILTIFGAISEQGNSLTVLSVAWKVQYF